MATRFRRKSSVPLTIVKTGFLVGTLDAVAAIIWSYCYTQSITLNVFKFIASGLFGQAAFEGGNVMVLYGLFIHYLIAFIFTISLFLLYPFFNFILRYKFLIGILYGAAIWVVMNLITLPLSKAVAQPLTVIHIIIGAAVSIICVGLPIALIAHSYYYKVKGRLLYL